MLAANEERHRISAGIWSSYRSAGLGEKVPLLLKSRFTAMSQNDLIFFNLGFIYIRTQHHEMVYGLAMCLCVTCAPYARADVIFAVTSARELIHSIVPHLEQFNFDGDYGAQDQFEAVNAIDFRPAKRFVVCIGQCTWQHLSAVHSQYHHRSSYENWLGHHWYYGSFMGSTSIQRRFDPYCYG